MRMPHLLGMALIAFTGFGSTYGLAEEASPDYSRNLELTAMFCI